MMRMRPADESVPKDMMASTPLNMQAAPRSRHVLMTPCERGLAVGEEVAASVIRGDPHVEQNLASAYVGD